MHNKSVLLMLFAISFDVRFVSRVLWSAERFIKKNAQHLIEEIIAFH